MVFWALVSGGWKRIRHAAATQTLASLRLRRENKKPLLGFLASVSGPECSTWSGRSAGTCLSPRLSSGHKADKIQISPLLTPPPQSSGAARHRGKRLVRSDLPPTRFVWIIQLKPNFSLVSQSSSKPEDQRNFFSSRSVNTIVSFFFRLFAVVFSPPPGSSAH